MRKSKAPLLVNISGSRYVGITCACERIARCLTAMGFDTAIIKLTTAREVSEFEMNLSLDGFAGVDVILFDKHFYTETAARRGLGAGLWSDKDGMPDISVLMTPATSPKSRHETYLKMPIGHYGTDNHHIVSTKGANGRLYAAGNIKALILREMVNA